MKKLFLSGLIVLLPIAITYWIIKFLINLITKPFQDFFTALFYRFDLFQEGFHPLTQEHIIVLLSKVAVIITLIATIFFVGFITEKTLFHLLLRLADKILHTIPMVNKVYLACKDFTSALFSPKSGSFSQVVLVPFPSEKTLSIGLITSEFANEVLEARADRFISVLVPGTPNPTIGLLLMFTADQVIMTDMKVDEAIKYVMSCASVKPSHLIYD